MEMCLEALDISLAATTTETEEDDDVKDHLSRFFLRIFRLKRIADENELSVVIR